jgi:hypothetical protein
VQSDNVPPTQNASDTDNPIVVSVQYDELRHFCEYSLTNLTSTSAAQTVVGEPIEVFTQTGYF